MYKFDQIKLQFNIQCAKEYDTFLRHNIIFTSTTEALRFS